MRSGRKLGTIACILLPLFIPVFCQASNAMETSLQQKRDQILEWQANQWATVHYFRNHLMGPVASYSYTLHIGLHAGATATVTLHEWHPEKQQFTSIVKIQWADKRIEWVLYDRSE